MYLYILYTCRLILQNGHNTHKKFLPLEMSFTSHQKLKMSRDGNAKPMVSSAEHKGSVEMYFVR